VKDEKWRALVPGDLTWPCLATGHELVISTGLFEGVGSRYVLSVVEEELFECDGSSLDGFLVIQIDCGNDEINYCLLS
jgi:hypothetical protein